jgi:hypothetical protein
MDYGRVFLFGYLIETWKPASRARALPGGIAEGTRMQSSRTTTAAVPGDTTQDGFSYSAEAYCVLTSSAGKRPTGFSPCVDDTVRW